MASPTSLVSMVTGPERIATVHEGTFATVPASKRAVPHINRGRTRGVMSRVAAGRIVAMTVAVACVLATAVMVVAQAAPAAADASSDNTIVAYGAAPFLGPQQALKLATPLV